MSTDAARASDVDTPPAPQLPMTYYTSRRTALLVLVGSLCFVAIGYYLIAQTSIPHNVSPLKVRIAGLVAIVFFSLGIPVGVFLLIRKKWLVALNERGMLIRGYRRAIAWSEIADIDLVYQDVAGTSQEIEWIGIFLEDTSVYYASLTPALRRSAARMERRFGTPILINCYWLPVKADTLVAWLDEYRAEYSQ
jgi:hypothetical protein